MIDGEDVAFAIGDGDDVRSVYGRGGGLSDGLDLRGGELRDGRRRVRRV